MKPVESYDIKMLSIGFYFTISSNLERTMASKALENDFDADWEN
jgi:hypothetical protein